MKMFFDWTIIKGEIKKMQGIFLPILLWFLVWGTYNTDIFRIFSKGFPHSAFDLIHGLRSFFPFVALIMAIIILFKGRKLTFEFLKGPLGFLLLYVVVGIFASFLSKNPWLSLYWGILYLSVIIILFSIIMGPSAKENIRFVMMFNFIIVLIITFSLTIIFFIKNGGISFEMVTQFLEGKRPYEGIGSLNAETITLGMAGTRPTGLGRYAGLSILLLFATFWHASKKIKIVSYLLFATTLPILIFTRARTSVIAFIVAIILMGFLKSKYKINFTFIAIAIGLLLFVTNVWQFSYAYLKNENLLESKNRIIINQPAPTETIKTSPQVIDDKTKPVEVVSDKKETKITPSVKESVGAINVATLGGRTTGIWPLSWNLFLTSPLVGRGFFADRIFLEGQHAHNVILQALVQTGILGTLFFLIAIIYSWILSVRIFLKNPHNLALFSIIGILAYFTIRGISESFAFFGADYLFVAPAIAYLQVFSESQTTS